MRIIFSVLLLGMLASHAAAQHHTAVTHLTGTCNAGNNEVTIGSYGKDPSNRRFGDVGPYHIGNANSANGYDFHFDQPVKHVKIDLTALDAGERIEIGVNGNKYPLTRKNLTPYTERMRTGLQTDDGIIAFSDKNTMASVVVNISPGYDIHSVYVHHLNGAAAGAVFGLSFPADAGETTTGIVGTVNPWSLSLYPNPTGGDLVLTGNGLTGPEFDLEVINAAGQKLYSRRVTKKGSEINETIRLDGALANGVYMLHVIDGEKKQALRFTLDR